MDSKNTDDYEQRLFVLGIYGKLLMGMQHFDGIQTTYRSISSTFLLATVAVIGFLYSGVGARLPFSPVVGAGVSSLLALVAISSIILNDLVFQERMLMANEVEAAKLERKYDWLPNLYENILRRSFSIYKVCYYVGCTTLLWVLAGIHAFLIVKHEGLIPIIITLSLVVFAIILYVVVLWRLAKVHATFINKQLNKEVY